MPPVVGAGGGGVAQHKRRKLSLLANAALERAFTSCA
jgi:hypothetical protein